MSRRARSLALLALSAICAGIAASLVSGYEKDVRAQVGPLVPVQVARRELPRGTTITPGNVRSYLERRRVPARFAPPSTLQFARDALGLRALTKIPAGSYLGETQLGLPSPRRPRATGAAGRGRLVEVPVAGAAALGDALRPRARVDVLITSDRGLGGARTYLALQRVELADFRGGEAPAGGDGPQRADAVAMLRVTLRQAVLLTAAQNFARELRLVPRPTDDDRRLKTTVVRASELRP